MRGQIKEEELPVHTRHALLNKTTHTRAHAHTLQREEAREEEEPPELGGSGEEGSQPITMEMGGGSSNARFLNTFSGPLRAPKRHFS